MSSHDSSSGPQPDLPASERLDSWKEIASYLKRSVRSVQRWEAEEGMPVHRHLHEKRGTVYGFKSELDAWWKERGAILADRNGEEEATLLPEVAPAPGFEAPSPTIEVPEQRGAVASPVQRKSVRVALMATGFVLAVLLVVLVASLSRNGSSSAARRPLPFKARDWVLVTSFDNRTGRPIFDGTLEAALERELRDSRYLNVIPRERILSALALMRLPAETRVDSTLGREICLRDGNIRALVTGRVEKLGSRYSLSIDIVDPADGVTVASVAEQASGEEDALPTIQRVSNRLRRMLGEALPEHGQDEARLAKVTTRSLKALRLYSQAEPLLMKKPAAAQELLRQVVQDDPEFAMGHMALSWALFNESAPGRVPEEHLALSETALRLSGSATDRERYLIRAGYFFQRDDSARAIAAYEAVLALYPDDVGALNDLVPLYRNSGRRAESVRCALRRADLTPDDFRNQILALLHGGFGDGDLAGVEPYVKRARELISTDVLDRVPQQAAVVEMYPAIRLWAEGNGAKAASEAERIWREVESKPLGRRDKGLESFASFFLSLGKLRIAEEVYDRVSSPELRLRGLAMVSYYRGDEPGLKERLKTAVARSGEISLWGVTGVPPADPVLGILLARSGMISDAERIVAREKRRESIPAFLEVVQGEVALARGRTAEAVRLLESCCNPGEGPGPSYAFGMESLALALDKEGKSEEAIRVLDQTSRGKPWDISNWSSDGHAWLRTRALLPRLYRKVGREDDARKVEEELSRFLSQADSDHALLAARTRPSNTIASGKASAP